MMRIAKDVPPKLEQTIVNDINTVNGSKHFWKLDIGQNGVMLLFFRDHVGDERNFDKAQWKWFEKIPLELPVE